jgi:hypothetical protein
MEGWQGVKHTCVLGGGWTGPASGRAAHAWGLAGRAGEGICCRQRPVQQQEQQPPLGARTGQPQYCPGPPTPPTCVSQAWRFCSSHSMYEP